MLGRSLVGETSSSQWRGVLADALGKARYVSPLRERASFIAAGGRDPRRASDSAQAGLRQRVGSSVGHLTALSDTLPPAGASPPASRFPAFSNLCRGWHTGC